MGEQTLCCFGPTVRFSSICFGTILKLAEALLHQELVGVLRPQSTISPFKLRLVLQPAYRPRLSNSRASWN
jgi:hypothetical protein